MKIEHLKFWFDRKNWIFHSEELYGFSKVIYLMIHFYEWIVLSPFLSSVINKHFYCHCTIASGGSICNMQGILKGFELFFESKRWDCDLRCIKFKKCSSTFYSMIIGGSCKCDSIELNWNASTKSFENLFILSCIWLSLAFITIHYSAILCTRKIVVDWRRRRIVRKLIVRILFIEIS